MTRAEYTPAERHRFAKGLAVVVILTAACIALATGSASAAPGPPPPNDITLVPQVQLDLGLAEAYWQVTSSDLRAPCSPVYVTVRPMTNATAANGTSIPVNNIAAETVIGTCDIALAPVLWQMRFTASGRYLICDVLAHEYGHVLGLPDNWGNDMMDADPATPARQDALCAKVYTPRHVTRFEHRWLAENTG